MIDYFMEPAEHSVTEIIEHYMELHKGLIDNEVKYLEQLIFSLEFLKSYYEIEGEESS